MEKYPILHWLTVVLLVLIFAPPVVAADGGPVAETPEGSESLLQEGDLWGGTHTFHPFLALKQVFTDNLFNTEDNEQSEAYTVISPGFWLAVPGSRQPLLDVPTLNSAPGGLALSRFRTDDRRRVQGYALYRADIRRHRDFNDEERVYQRAEGLGQIRLGRGLLFELLDIYEISQDPYGNGESQQLDEYDANYLNPSLEIPLASKVRWQVGYATYALDYEESRNAFRERRDQAWQSGLYFRLWPKTSAFLTYEQIDVEYELASGQDSRERHYFAGLQWDHSSRWTGRTRFGYGEKDYEETGIEERQDFVGEVRLDYRYSSRTRSFLRAVRLTRETDVEGALDVLAHRIQVGLSQNLSPKLLSTVTGQYRRDSYREVFLSPGDVTRADDYFGLDVSLGYALKNWLNLGVGYVYGERSSTRSGFDYRNNTVYFSVSAAL